MRLKDDPAAATLALALESLGDWPGAGRTAFLRARWHPFLNDAVEGIVCEQTWKPSWDRLAEAGIPAAGNLLSEWGGFDLVLLLPDRQREQTLFDLARGMRLLRPGGRLIVSLPNDWGAVRFEKHLAELAGEAGSLSKFHCRAFCATHTAALDRERLAEWFGCGSFRPAVHAGWSGPPFMSCPGLFSWDEIDRGSKLLVDHLPDSLSGRAADLGCGWGYLSWQLANTRPLVTHIDLYDADAIALEAARANLSPMPATAAAIAGGPIDRSAAPDRSRATTEFHGLDVTKGLEGSAYACIVMNPPFHAGRAADPLLGHRFIAAAARGIRPGGQLWMVANQNLPYERFLADALPGARLVVQRDGFKVLTACRRSR
jgi:16S rRNA (guanine1207-N2)-methyltransferase